MPSNRNCIHELFTSLDDRMPWTMGLVSLVQHLAWETEDVLGISRSELIKGVVIETIKELYKTQIDLTRFYSRYFDADGNLLSKKEIKNNHNGDSCDENDIDIIDNICKRYQSMISKTTSAERYSNPTPKRLTSAYETQRKLRYFSENFLNKELDVFLGLLPDSMITSYLQNHFPEINDNNGSWNVYAWSNEFDLSVRSAGQPDTIIYNNKSGCLVGIEIKIDATLQEDQLLKYCCIYHDLVDKGFICTDDFKFFVISNENYDSTDFNDLRKNTITKLDHIINSPKSVKGSLLRYRDHHEHILSIINSVRLSSTTWQQLGEYFDNILNLNPVTYGNDYSNCLNKIIGGFVDSLSKKYSRKLNRTLYQRGNER